MANAMALATWAADWPAKTLTAIAAGLTSGPPVVNSNETVSVAPVQTLT